VERQVGEREIAVGRLDELEDPGCREFSIGNGEWPFRGFVVRKGDQVYAYRNFCVHVGHPLNWSPDRFLTKDKREQRFSDHAPLIMDYDWAHDG